MASFNSAVIARVAAGLYDVQLGNQTMTWAENAINSVTYGGSIGALVQQLYNNDFKGAQKSNADVAAIIVANVGITNDAGAVTYVAGLLDSAAGVEGQAIVDILNAFSAITTGTYAAAAAAFNGQIADAVAWAQQPGSVDAPVHPASSVVFNLVPTAAAGADVMRLTGNQDVRIDFTNPANQITGLDVDGDGLIEFNGVERSITGMAADFEIVDAYSRNPLNHLDSANNFLGDIYFDGTGFDGDGVNTDGNIFLGGLGHDEAFGGIGNDFLAGGGIAQGHGGTDIMRGGRNADYFFAEFSGLDATDGSSLLVDGGNTADDTAAGNGQSGQDSDWLLFEASDDDEPVQIWLNDDNAGFTEPGDGIDDNMGRVLSRSGESMQLDDVENIDASGNFYGFLDDMDVEIGGRAVDDRDVAGTENYGLGSSAQLWVSGSEAGNKVIGGYDNDYIAGNGGNDLIFGGNLQFFFENVADGVTNPNLAGIKLDGKDSLYGGKGDDNIVLELDKGTAAGDDHSSQGDTLWITNYTVGRFGPTEAESAATILNDGKVRIDLGYASYRGYRGDTLGENTDHSDEANQTSTSDHTPGTADQTVYKSYSATTVTGFENVVATGMGGIDYLSAGSNNPDLSFHNEQNFYGTAVDLELRGTDGSTVVFVTSSVTVTDEGDYTEAEMHQLYVEYLSAYAVANGDDGDELSEEDFIDFLEGQGVTIESTSTTSTTTAQAVVRTGANTLYAGSGDDILEGRGGDDKLSGGAGDDDFVFGLADAYGHNSNHGDDVDVIWRQSQDPAKEANITNGAFQRDFGVEDSTSLGASVLQIAVKKAGGNAAGDELDDVVNRVTEIVTGVKVGGSFQTITLNTEAIKNATTYTGLVAAINAALDDTAFGADLQATLQSDGITIFITDAQGRELADTDSEVRGAGVSVSQKANTATENTFVYGEPEEIPSGDRIIYKSYEDRSKNEGTDDDAVLGSTISLGKDNYAEDLVIDFNSDGTRLAEDQMYAVQLKDLSVEDLVTISINDVKYILQVGVEVDGTLIAGESNNAFVARMATYINEFLDDDTAAGKVVAAAVGDTLQITQAAYNDGEETVFMRTPVVTMVNHSGGQKPSSAVTNLSSHEVHLYQFDGRDGELNRDNVLFVGEEFTNRAVLETAENTGGELLGSDAMVVYVANNTSIDNITSSAAEGLDGAEIEFNTVANLATQFDENFAVHGDDLLLGGTGLDSIWAGTGDDRVHGSRGGSTSTPERLDGGKDLYLVDHVIRVANDYDASVFDADPSVVSIERIDQTETGTFLESAFEDTLIYQQRDFGVVGAGGAQFYIELSDDVMRENGGEGWVTTTEGSTVTGYAYFTNFEHIRTVSGDGTLAGQGNDTLDFADLSDETGGVFYNLSNNTATDAGNDWPDGPVIDEAGPGSVLINFGENWGWFLDDSVIDIPGGDVAIDPNNVWIVDGGVTGADGDDELFMRVDGVENVIGGDGNDGVYIDETEAGKHNSINLGLGDDIVLYGNRFDDGPHIDSSQVPTVTLKVNYATNTDRVEMIGGRVGTVAAADTLVGVEALSFATDDENLDGAGAAASSREDDVLDVSRVSGATVDYTNGYITTGGTIEQGGTAQVIVYGVSEFEIVTGSGSNDQAVIADTMVNSREDDGDGDVPVDVGFDTFLNYDMVNDWSDGDDDTDDDLDNDGAVWDRMSVAELRAIGTTGVDVNPWGQDDIPEGLNIGQYQFNLGGGTGDTVDYFAETDRIAAVVTPGNATSRVLVLGADEDLEDASDRVDLLTGVERIVAAQGESILDFTAANQDIQIDFQFPPTRNGGTLGSGILEEDDVIESIVRIADGNGNIVTGISNMIERYVVGEYESNGGAQNVGQATWNRIEGSDYAERITYDGSEDLLGQAGIDHRYSDDTLNLRGGANNVSYSPLETSITATITIEAFDLDTFDPMNSLSSGFIHAEVEFQDGDNGTLDGGGTHNIYSFTADNELAAGSLKLEASQDKEDTVIFDLDSDKIFVLGTSPGVIKAEIADADEVGTMILTGFEILQDNGDSDDVYTMDDIDNVLGDLELRDDTYYGADPTASEDNDTLKLNDEDAINYNEGAADASNEVDTIKLESFNDAFGFDFDILDISGISDNDLVYVRGDDDDQDDDATLNDSDADYTGPADVDDDGDADAARYTADDQVILGDLDSIDEVTLFTVIWLTDASIDSTGDEFVLDTDLGEFRDGDGDVVFDTDAAGLDFSRVTTDGVTVEVVGGLDGVSVVGSGQADTISGGAGDDVIRGGSGNDTLSGGVDPEDLEILTFGFNNGGTLGSSFATVSDYIEITDGTGYIRLFADGSVVGNDGVNPDVTIVTAAVGVDIPASADNDVVGNAIANVADVHWATYLTEFEIGDVSYDATGNVLSFTYASGENVAALSDLTMTVVDAGAAGTLEANTAVVDGAVVNAAQGQNYAAEVNSADDFLFEASGAANGTDTINAFDTSDVLDFSLFFSTSNIAALNAVLTANPVAVNVENDVNRLVDITGGQNITTAAGLAAALAAGGEYEDVNMAVSSKALFVTADSSDANESQYVFMATSSSTGAISVSLVGVVTGYDIDSWDVSDFAG